MPYSVLGRLKLIVCFASKHFQNPMREGESVAQTPEKSTDLFHCHLAFNTKLEHLWSKIWGHNSDGCKY